MGVPKWLQKLSNATIKAAIAADPAVATASGWTINNGEAQQNATEDPGVQQLRENLAVLGGIATGITAAPLVATPTAAKLIREAAASMLGGETVDQIHRGITGQSFGRGMASLLGQQNVYDRSALARFGYDMLNPGFFLGGLVRKGVNTGIDAAKRTIVNIEKLPDVNKLASKGVFTRRNPDYYTGKPRTLAHDYITGKSYALGYLGSNRKATTDLYNEKLYSRFKNYLKNPSDFSIENFPQRRAATPMKRPGTLDPDMQWYGTDTDGFILYSGPEEVSGELVRNLKHPELDEMYLSKNFDIDDAAFHEYLHRGNVGNGMNEGTKQFYIWKNKSILKPGFEKFKAGYLTDPEETAVNLLEIGRRADILNTSYPGPEKAKTILQDIIKNDLEKGSILNQTKWETKPKRVWDALQGKYIGIFPLGTGLMIYDKQKNNTKQQTE